MPHFFDCIVDAAVEEQFTGEVIDDCFNTVITDTTKSGKEPKSFITRHLLHDGVELWTVSKTLLSLNIIF